MRRIVHDNPAPPSLTALAAGHTQPGFVPRDAWKDFYGRQEVKDRLYPLQKGLCAYCESRLSREGSHIEHIRRKSLHHEETFNWHNLVLSCQCLDSCGHYKDRDRNLRPAVSDDPKFIKPTDSDCSRYYFYHKNGSIAPSPNLSDAAEIGKAQFTIDALGLQTSSRLVRERGCILAQYYRNLESLKDQPSALDAYLQTQFPAAGESPVAYWTAREQHRDLFKQAYHGK